MTLRSLSVLIGILFIGCRSQATTITLNFEGFPDSTILTTQYSGVTFSNAIILTSGISLNEFEFPPHSGVNVVSDNGGPMSLNFSTPITTFAGYFTYAEALTLDAYGSSNNLLVSVASTYSNNEAISGDAGSSPNEFIQLSSLSAISEITITGDPAGGSFVLDDATYTTSTTVSPEPSYSALLTLCFFAGLILFRFRSRKTPAARAATGDVENI
jgi:hypothetical protein